jgi:hypothetical protein
MRRYILATLVLANAFLLIVWTPPVSASADNFGNCGASSGDCECQQVCGGIEECNEVPGPIEWSCVSDIMCSQCCC